MGTFVLDPGLYQQMAEKLAALAKALTDYGVTLEYLDVGGGYASYNTLHDQWMPAEYATPNVDQYAEAICPTLIKVLPQPHPLLILEPGRALVDEAVHLLASVVSVKYLTSGQKGVVLDAGINQLSNVAWYRYEVRAATPAGSLSAGSVLEEVNLYGPLCMNIDILQSKVALPPLRMGDILIFKNVGAYNLSQSNQFIQPRPAVVLINEGEAEVIRAPETTAYIRQLERIPPRVQPKPPRASQAKG
jgi:diaminopimelate decarboxylase